MVTVQIQMCWFILLPFSLTSVRVSYVNPWGHIAYAASQVLENQVARRRFF